MFIRFILLFCVSTSTALAYDVPYHWNYINYTWPSEDVYNSAIKNGNYILENNVITGIKIWKDRIYLAVPRWRKGTPVTLASIPIKSAKNEVSPLLEPYPNWNMQKPEDCSAFQYIQSMEIDPKGKMWIIDNGRIYFTTNDSRTSCPARLIVIDLEDNGKILLNYVFPDNVVHMSSVFLNDIVLDHEDGGWAYITDNDSLFPGIIVFSLKTKESWKVFHESMAVQDNAVNLTINGTRLQLKSPVNGIALSGASYGNSKTTRKVFFNPVSSFNLHSVSTSVLKLAPKLSSTDIQKSFVREGKKPQTTGMVMSAKSNLYFSLLPQDAVAIWNTYRSFNKDYKIFIQDHENSQFPDGMAVDDNGQLWYISNRIQIFSTSKYDVNQVNFRLIRASIGSKNYQYLKNGSVPSGIW